MRVQLFKLRTILRNLQEQHLQLCPARCCKENVVLTTDLACVNMSRVNTKTTVGCAEATMPSPRALVQPVAQSAVTSLQLYSCCTRGNQ